jgi:hypothetical protein
VLVDKLTVEVDMIVKDEIVVEEDDKAFEVDH